MSRGRSANRKKSESKQIDEAAWESAQKRNKQGL